MSDNNNNNNNNTDEQQQQQQQQQQQSDRQKRQEEARAARAAAEAAEKAADETDDDDGKDAFLDLDDPDVEVVPDVAPASGTAGADDDDDDDDDDDKTSQGAANEEEADWKTINGEPIVDKTPERDDAFLVCKPPASDQGNEKPLHCVAVHPTDPTVIACAGEADLVYVLKLPDVVPAGFAAPVGKSAAAAAAAAAASAAASEETACETPAADSGSNAYSAKRSDWNVLATLRGHKDTVTKLSFAPTGKMLASAGMDGKICLWNTDMASADKQNPLLKELTDLEGTEIESLLWHPSGMMIAAGSLDAQIILWNAVKGTAAQYFAGHRDAVTCLAWSNDVKKLISASADGSVAMHDPKTGAVVVSVGKGISDETAGISSMLVLPTPPGGSADAPPMVLVGCFSGEMALVSLQTPKGRVLNKLADVHDQAVESLALSGSASANLVASCSCDCKLVLWSVPDFTPRATIAVGEGMTKTMWFDSNVVVAACTDGDVRCYDARVAAAATTTSGGAAAAVPQVHFLGHRRLVLDAEVARLPSGPVLVSVADDATVRAYSMKF